MPALPSNTPIDTHDRFRADNDLQRRFLSPNLIVNPGFQHIEWVDPATHFTFGGWTNGEPSWLRYAAGWFPFGTSGGAGGNQDVNVSTTLVQDSPLRSRSGIELTQEQNRRGGLVQELPNAEFIRGRRVRVSGIYNLPAATPIATAGISIWLKGQKLTEDVAAASWGVGGLGYDEIPLTDANAKFVIQVLPGLSQTFGAGPTAHIACYDELRNTSGNPFIHMRGGDSGAEAGSTTRHDVTVFYLDRGFSNVLATDGSLRLFSETQGAQGTYYFETFIDIPDDDDLFENNVCHIIVMPVDPTDVAGMSAAVDFRLYALNMEVVLDDANLEDRVLHGGLTSQAYPLGYGDGSGRLAQNYLLRNPIYVPKIYPLLQGFGTFQDSLAGLAVANLDTWGLGTTVATPVDPNMGYFRYFHNGGASAAHPVVQCPNLPPGASIVRAGLTVHLDADPNVVGYEELYLLESVAYVPTGDTPFSDLDNARVVAVMQNSTPITGVGTTTTHLQVARRNRVGLYWNEQTDNTLTNGTLGAAEHALVGTVGVDARIHLGGAWMVVAADPRLAHASYLPEP